MSGAMPNDTKTLSPEQIEAVLTDHPHWAIEAGMFTRTWTFPTFIDAIAFVQRVAELAEKADHHPDIDIRYTRVRLALISHDIAALSPRDARMVRQIDALRSA